MVINNFRLVACLLTASLFLIKCNCKKLQFDCTQIKYTFQVPLKAYPDKDSINIGDTIWFEINTAVKLKDTISGQMIDYANAGNLGSLVTFDRLSTAGQFTDRAANRFTYFLRFGREIPALDANWEKNYLFAEVNGRYIFLLGVIANEKGTYRILFSNSNNTYRNNDRCNKANFSFLFENTNQHYPLSPFYIPGTSPRGRDYYFVVK
jgi:hypothetical protein